MSDNDQVQVFWHDDCLRHDTGRGVWEAPASDLVAVLDRHPENADRLRNMRAVLQRGPIKDRLQWHTGRYATVEELCTVHDAAYVEALRAAMAGGREVRYGDGGNTVVGAHGTWEAATAAAGTALAAADAVLGGSTRTAYALIRPPGHHAQPAQADGYCFFNNAALAAQRARSHGLPRVAVVDWDAHHGNGTQACFYDRADVLTISLHMRTGLWGSSHLQTGAPAEVGARAGQGYNVNIELPVGSGDQTYEAAMCEIVAPILRQYQPALLIGASGQDASAFDPNARQNVSMAGFRAIGRTMGALADELCGGRLLLVQEGGYAPTYAAYCLHATLEGVLNVAEPLLADPLAYVADDFARARDGIAFVKSALSRYWKLAL